MLLEGVSFLALESRNDGVLWACNPSCVITHDLDLAFVRQLEVGYYLSCLLESLIFNYTGGAQRTSCASLREPLGRFKSRPFPWGL